MIIPVDKHGVTYRVFHLYPPVGHPLKGQKTHGNIPGSNSILVTNQAIIIMFSRCHTEQKPKKRQANNGKSDVQSKVNLPGLLIRLSASPSTRVSKTIICIYRLLTTSNFNNKTHPSIENKFKVKYIDFIGSLFLTKLFFFHIISRRQNLLNCSSMIIFLFLSFFLFLDDLCF